MIVPRGAPVGARVSAGATAEGSVRGAPAGSRRTASAIATSTRSTTAARTYHGRRSAVAVRRLPAAVETGSPRLRISPYGTHARTGREPILLALPLRAGGADRA